MALGCALVCAHPYHRMDTPPNLNAQPLKHDKMVNEAAIQLALADLQLQEVVNYTLIAKKYDISHVTLM